MGGKLRQSGVETAPKWRHCAIVASKLRQRGAKAAPLWVEHAAFLGTIINWTSPSDVTTGLDENTHDLNMSTFDSYTAWSETGRGGLREESLRESSVFGSFQ